MNLLQILEPHVVVLLFCFYNGRIEKTRHRWNIGNYLSSCSGAKNARVLQITDLWNIILLFTCRSEHSFRLNLADLYSNRDKLRYLLIEWTGGCNEATTFLQTYLFSSIWKGFNDSFWEKWDVVLYLVCISSFIFMNISIHTLLFLFFGEVNLI